MKKRKAGTKIIAFMLLTMLCAGLFSGCSKDAAGTSDKASSPIDIAEETRSTLRFPSRQLYHYDMDLTLNDADNTVSGHVVFDFYNDSDDNWDRLCMRDYPSLYTDPKKVGYNEMNEMYYAEYDGRLTEITNIMDGRDGSALEYKRDDDVSVIWLELAKPLAPGEKLTLEYDFVTTIPTLTDRFGFKDDVYDVTNFYPILAEYADGEWSHTAFVPVGECFYSEVSDYDVRLTVPAGYTVATTGMETAKRDNGDTVTYTYYAPCVRDFVFSASTNYICESKIFDGVNVNVVYRKNNSANDITPSIETAFLTAENSLAVFGETLGIYPYDELDVVVSPYLGSGMEYPNLVLISEGYCREKAVSTGDGFEIVADTKSLEICIAHEIGHQWFMGIVGSNSGMQPWQDESLTSYLELVYWDNAHDGNYDHTGATALPRSKVDLSDPSKVALLKENKQLPIDQSYYDYAKDSLYQDSIYNIGQRVFYQIEEIIGRKEMYAVLHDYVHRNAFTNADPSCFFDVLYEHAGTDNDKLNILIGDAFGADAQAA